MRKWLAGKGKQGRKREAEKEQKVFLRLATHHAPPVTRQGVTGDGGAAASVGRRLRVDGAVENLQLLDGEMLQTAGEQIADLLGRQAGTAGDLSAAEV